MKPPEFWQKKYGCLFCDQFAEIQRDAREGMIDRKLSQETLEEAMEGMVPLEDVRKLVEGLEQIAIAGNAGMPNLPRVTGGAMRTTKGFSQDLLTDFRAKHPNLFTK